MATYQQYTKNGVKLWKAQVYLGLDPYTHKKVTTKRSGFKTKKEAQKAINKLKMDFENKGKIEKSNIITFNDLYEQWLPSYTNTVSQATLNKVTAMFNNHVFVKGALDGVLVEKVTLPFAQKLVNKWSGELVYFNKLVQYVSKVFDFAIDMDIITKNQFKSVTLPKKKITSKNTVKSSDNWLDKDQLQEFFSGLDKSYNGDDKELVSVYFRLLAFTGARKSELLSLTWSDIDLASSTISINKTITRGLDNKLFVSNTTKTQAGTRTLIIDENTITMLKRWRMLQRSVMFEYGFNIGAKSDQLVFSRFIDNSLINVMTPNHWLKKILTNTNLPTITIHGFRHTYATLAIEAGMNVKQLQKQLGHTDVKTTLDIYAAVTEKGQHESTELFSSYVGF